MRQGKTVRLIAALDLPENLDSLKELQGLVKGMDIDDNGTINYTGIPFQL
jgi:hypothetical protein